MFAGTHIYCVCVLLFKNLYVCKSVWHSRSLFLFLQKNGIMLSLLLIGLFSTAISYIFPFFYSSIQWFLMFAECFNILDECYLFHNPFMLKFRLFLFIVIINRQIYLHLRIQHSEDFSLCLYLSLLLSFLSSCWWILRFLDQRDIMPFLI